MNPAVGGGSGGLNKLGPAQILHADFFLIKPFKKSSLRLNPWWAAEVEGKTTGVSRPQGSASMILIPAFQCGTGKQNALGHALRPAV
jgi:hypothetical protein